MGDVLRATTRNCCALKPLASLKGIKRLPKRTSIQLGMHYSLFLEGISVTVARTVISLCSSSLFFPFGAWLVYVCAISIKAGSPYAFKSYFCLKNTRYWAVCLTGNLLPKNWL